MNRLFALRDSVLSLTTFLSNVWMISITISLESLLISSKNERMILPCVKNSSFIWEFWNFRCARTYLWAIRRSVGFFLSVPLAKIAAFFPVIKNVTNLFSVISRLAKTNFALTPPSKLTTSVSSLIHGDIRWSFALGDWKARFMSRNWSFCSKCLHNASPNSLNSRREDIVFKNDARIDGIKDINESSLVLSPYDHVCMISAKHTAGSCSSAGLENCESQYDFRILRPFVLWAAFSSRVSLIDVRKSLKARTPGKTRWLLVYRSNIL